MPMFLTAPILTYAVITDPFPLLASAENGNLNKAKFTALATNGTGSDVVLEGIIVQFPVGNDAASLTLDPALIGPVAPANWRLSSTQTPSGLVIYVFQPLSGQATVPKGQSLAFVFNNIEVNRKAGTFAVQITEGSGNCVPPDCPTYTTYITKFPNAWGQVAFWASPANIPYQGNTTLQWSGPQGAIYAIEYMARGQVINIPKQGEPPLANQGQYPGAHDPELVLEATTPFTLNVSERIDNEEFFAQQQVTVSVGPPPPPMPRILKFQGSVALDGTQLFLTLSWETERAEQITITHVNGFQKPVDKLVVRPSAADPLAGTYTLEARTETNAVTATVSILWTAYKGAPAGQIPSDCAILPDGSRLFSNDQWNSSVFVYDPLTLASVSGSPFKVPGPSSIAASPDSSRVYITSEKDGEPRLYGFDSRNFSNVPGSPVDRPGTAVSVGVSPDGQRVYVVGPSYLRVYDTSTMKPIGSMGLAELSNRIALTPDGARAFVPNYYPGSVSVIDTAKLSEITAIRFGQSLVDVAVTPDGKQLYVADLYGYALSVFDPVTLEQLPGSPIRLPAGPYRLGVSPDGSLLFALSGTGGNRLFVIDTATRTVLGSSGTAGSAVNLAVSPDGVRVFVLAQDGNQLWMFLPSATGGMG